MGMEDLKQKALKEIELKEIEVLLRLFERSSLTEMVVERGGLRLTFKRQWQSQSQGQGPLSLSLSPSPPPPPARDREPPGPGEVEVEETVSEEEAELLSSIKITEEAQVEPEGKLIVRSPMVGVFHRRPGPGKEPFVEVGTQVKEGDILGMIEAMKVLTEVRAAEEGIVEQIMVEDGQPVEYGQGLMLIRPLR